MSGEGTEPTYVIEGREALTPIFADLDQYEATTHFNGQSTIALCGDSATGEELHDRSSLLYRRGEAVVDSERDRGPTQWRGRART
jgi:hypothetical protein